MSTAAVFVETNWVVAIAAPHYLRMPDAESLLVKAQKGQFRLLLPSICLAEARRTITRKFRPRNQADDIRKFLRYEKTGNRISEEECNTTFSVLSLYETRLNGYLDTIDKEIQKICNESTLEIFSLNEYMLIQAIELGASTLDLKPIDEAVLAAVLVRSRELKAEGVTTISFCELDSDLQPWDRNGKRKPLLDDLYDKTSVKVYSGFDLPSMDTSGNE